MHQEICRYATSSNTVNGREFSHGPRAIKDRTGAGCVLFWVARWDWAFLFLVGACNTKPMSWSYIVLRFCFPELLQAVVEFSLSRCKNYLHNLLTFCLVSFSELFHTERTHVRNLKVLVHLFNRPMISLNILQPNDINLLFGKRQASLFGHLLEWVGCSDIPCSRTTHKVL